MSAAPGPPAPDPTMIDVRPALVRLLRALIPFLEQWKRDDPSRLARQWMDVREAMEVARAALTGDPRAQKGGRPEWGNELAHTPGSVWVMESRTNRGWAAVPAPPAGLTVERLTALLREMMGHDFPDHAQDAAWLLPRLSPVSPGAPPAARRAPTDVMIAAAWDAQMRCGIYACSKEAVAAGLRAALAAGNP